MTVAIWAVVNESKDKVEYRVTLADGREITQCAQVAKTASFEQRCEAARFHASVAFKFETILAFELLAVK